MRNKTSHNAILSIRPDKFEILNAQYSSLLRTIPRHDRLVGSG